MTQDEKWQAKYEEVNIFRRCLDCARHDRGGSVGMTRKGRDDGGIGLTNRILCGKIWLVLVF